MRKIGRVVLCLAVAQGGLMAQLKSPLPDENGVFVLQGGVTRPEIVRPAPAAYPDDPQLAQTRHTCVVSVVVGPDGSVESTDLENANPSAFDANALTAVKASTFTPGTVKGHPVAVRAQVWITFRGDGKPAIPATEHTTPFESPKPRSTPSPAASANADLFVSFIVTEDGRISDLRLIRPTGTALDSEVRMAVSHWQFYPAKLQGEAVPDQISTVLNFRKY